MKIKESGSENAIRSETDKYADTVRIISTIKAYAKSYIFVMHKNNKLTLSSTLPECLYYTNLDRLTKHVRSSAKILKIKYYFVIVSH